MNTERTIKLTTSDGGVFRISRECAKLSTLLDTCISDLKLDDLDDDNEARNIPLPKVNTSILKKVLTTDPQERGAEDICAWDAAFLKIDQATLFELIMAANYMDIKGLLDSACKTVASMIRGKCPDEIRRTFNIKNDFSPDEENLIRKENAWCED